MICKPIVQWRPCGVIPYLGQPIVLEYKINAPGHFYRGDYNHPTPGDQLILGVKAGLRSYPSADPLSTSDSTIPTEQIKTKAQEWFQGRALTWFAQRAAIYEARFGLKPKRLHLSSAMRLWGSCSSRQVIRLNWRLIHLESILIDYVLVHELAHLKQMNHSKAFWQEVEYLMPDYKVYETQLKQHHLEHYL